MKTMIERVAVALCVAKFGPEAVELFEPVPEGFDLSEQAKVMFAERTAQARKEARAAIEAMKEPTEGMFTMLIDSDKWEEPEPHSRYIDPADSWKDMINAALDGK